MSFSANGELCGCGRGGTGFDPAAGDVPAATASRAAGAAGGSSVTPSRAEESSGRAVSGIAATAGTRFGTAGAGVADSRFPHDATHNAKQDSRRSAFRSGADGDAGMMTPF